MIYILYFVLLSISNSIIQINKADKIFNYAVEKIGCGYIWGGKGQLLTEEKLKHFKNKFPGFINENIDKKWIGKQVFDCSGFVLSSFKQIGIHISHGVTAAWENTNWAIKGKIDNLPKDKIAILFKELEGQMIHAGIYLGNGEVVNAKIEGVVKEELRPVWTHFGIPYGLYE